MKKNIDQRKKKRVKADRLSLTFHNRSCRIFNISAGGVAFSINAPREVKIGKEMDIMILNNRDPIEVVGVARHISHISEIEPGADIRAEWVCGAEFTVQGNTELENRIQAFVKSVV